MINGIMTYSLECQEFCIDFEVEVPYSLEWTRGFNVKNDDFVFAVGEIWLRIKQDRYLLISEPHSGNLIEVLREFAKRFSQPTLVFNLEEVIPLGGWGRWMQGYWNRLNDDCSAVDDERIYDILINLSLISGRNGHIAYYEYNGVSVLEIATRPTLDEMPIFIWSEINPKAFACEALKLQAIMKDNILQNCRYD